MNDGIVKQIDICQLRIALSGNMPIHRGDIASFIMPEHDTGRLL